MIDNVTLNDDGKACKSCGIYKRSEKSGCGSRR